MRHEPFSEEPRLIDGREQRLAEIERVLKFDGAHPDRRQLIKEYIAICDEMEARLAKAS